MNPFEMVAVIVVVVMIASVLRARYQHHNRPYDEVAPEDRRENLQLREEVRDLKERIKVLERITVEKENSLAKEIESLRDR
jgi:hypothetical protein